METCALEDFANMRKLAAIAHDSDEPIVVLDGEDECLVAMSPSVFERILFDSGLLNLENRSSLALC